MATAELDFTEDIQLRVNIDLHMNCSVWVTFSFSGLDRPLNFINFQSEPSFVSLEINALFVTGQESTYVRISLNESKVSSDQGKLIAKRIAYKLANDFLIPILVPSTPAYYSPTLGVLEFLYESNYTSIELRNIFLESLPSQGFSKVLDSLLSKNPNYNIHIILWERGAAGLLSSRAMAELGSWFLTKRKS
ncbi:MAG: hypothetical protein QXZ70_01565 [Candidatus Bathyarchaeia archaeon]